MSSSPQRPAPSVAGISDGTGHQRREQVLDLVARQADQPGWWWVAGAFGNRHHDQEGVGDHGQGGPAVPGAPAADLVLVQATKALAGLEALFGVSTTVHSYTRTGGMISAPGVGWWC